MKKKIFALASIACALTMVMAAGCTVNGDINAGNNSGNNSGNNNGNNNGNTTTPENPNPENPNPENPNPENPNPDEPQIPDQIEGTVIWVIGDSTGCDFSTDKSDAVKYYPRVGFGVHLADYFNDTVTVRNIAWSGRSSKNYVTDEQSKVPYAEYTTNVKEGDYVIIAFGHNDEKAEEARYSNPNGDVNTEGSFQYNLYNYYMKVAEEKNATPILCTPIVRYDSKIASPDTAETAYADGTNTLHVWGGGSDAAGKEYEGGDYAAAVRTLATAKSATLIDNTKLTQAAWKAAGAESINYHARQKEDAKTVDGTHLNAYGAKQVAYMMANAIAGSDCTLKTHVKAGIAAPTKEADLKVNPDYVGDGEYKAPAEWNSIFESADETAGWHASAFGSLGGNPNTTNFEVSGGSTFDVTLSVKNNKGKIAAAEDGYLMYFKQVEASKDFTLSADMTILSLANNNQVGYGLVVRDDMYIDLNETKSSNYVAVGGLGPNSGNATASWTRSDGTLNKNATALNPSTTDTVLALKIEKTGNEYKVYVENELIETYTIDLTGVDKEYVYAGLMACRNASVNFANIKLEIK